MILGAAVALVGERFASLRWGRFAKITVAVIATGVMAGIVEGATNAALS